MRHGIREHVRRNGIAKKRKEANKNPDQTENDLLAKKGQARGKGGVQFAL